MARYIKAVRVDSGAEAPTTPPPPHPDTRAHLNPWISPLFRVIPALKGNEFLSEIMLVWRIKYTVSALDQDFSYLTQLK